MDTNQQPSFLDDIEANLQKFLRSHPECSGEISRVLGQVSTLKSDYQLIPGEEWQKMLDKLEQLSSPPLQYAVYLSPGQDAENVIVGVGRSRFEVALKEEEKRKAIQPGTEVLINEKNNIVSIGGEYNRGETAEVVNILKPDRSVEVLAINSTQPNGETTINVRWFNGKEAQLNCPSELVTPPHKLTKSDLVEVEVGRDGEPFSSKVLRKARPRLHVRSGGSEGEVVEISDRLFDEGVRIGDIVRLEPGIAFAFEKLPAYETGGLALEEVPDVTYDDIGGLEDQVEMIRDTIDLPYLHRGLFKQYQLKRPKGLFLYGPPGCGKTMVAKAIANDLTLSIRNHLTILERLIEEYRKCPPGDQKDEYEQRLLRFDLDIKDLNQSLRSIQTTLQAKDGIRSFFLNIKGPELLDKYVGETEHRIRKIFEQAQRSASFYTPVVIFFDEMEAMFRTRGSGRSSDVETTIVPQFLAEIDGVESSENIIIIGASNRPDMIDPAIIRPGRLDIKVKVDRPTRQSAIDIFSLYLLPILPMQSNGEKPDLTDSRIGQVVFRNGYKNACEGAHDKEREIITQLESVVPNGLDLRLTMSLGPDDLKRLGRLASQYLQARYLWQSNELKEDDPFSLKIRQFKPNIDLAQLINQVETFNQARKNDRDLESLVDRYIKNEWIAEGYIMQTVDILYSSGSYLSIICNTPSGPRKDVLQLKEFISGAVIASIVSRAKRAALKRDARPKDNQDKVENQTGLCMNDLHDGIYEEMEENKEQLAVNKIRSELGREADQLVSVELKLDTIHEELWREIKPRPYLSKDNRATYPM